jgi:hypothetical protein
VGGQQLFPEQLAEAIRPFMELIVGELQAATDSGLLKPENPGYDAWLVNLATV